MKFLLTAVVLSLSVFASHGQHKVFNIKYAVAVSDELKNIDVETETDSLKQQMAMVALFASMFQDADKPAVQAWVNKDFIRVETNSLYETTQITDKNSDESYILYPSMKQYTATSDASDKIIIDDSNEELVASTAADFPIEFVEGEQKKILGYTCKLARILISQEGDAQAIEIWYTEQIPSLYWGEYAYLKQLPGAALSIGTSGIGIAASEIKAENLKKSLFELPADYQEIAEFEEDTELDTDDLANEEEVLEEYAVAENIIVYADSITQLYGLKDATGQIITAPIFSNVSEYHSDHAIAADESYKYSVIDQKGKPQFPFTYDFLSYDQSNNTYLFYQDGKYGVLDNSYKITIPAKFDLLAFNVAGFSIFQQNERYGIVDEKGNEIIPATYSYIAENSKNNFIEVLDEMYTLYSIASNKKVSDTYNYMTYAGEDEIFLASKNDKYGYIDHTGKVIIPFKYMYATAFTDGQATVSLEGDSHYMTIDKTGKVIETAE